MPNPTQQVPSQITEYEESAFYWPLVTGATVAKTYQNGEMIGRRSDGFAGSFDDAAPMEFLGICNDINLQIGSTDGVRPIRLRRPYRIQMPIDTGTISRATHFGRPMYAATVANGGSGKCSLTPGTYGNIIGHLVDVIPTTEGGLTGTIAVIQVLPGDNIGGKQPIGASTAAAGSTNADAAALPAGTATVYPTTAADGVKGVIISTADKVSGRTIFIGNGVAAQILKVYPPAGGTINGAAANAAFVSVSGKGVIAICLDSSANTWLMF